VVSARVRAARARLVRVLAAPDRPPLALIGRGRGARDLLSPHVLYVVVYALSTSLTLALCVTAGLAAGLALYRLARRQPAWQAITGVATVGLSVLAAVLTGRPEGFFLPAVLRGAGLGLGLLLSVVIRWPLVGVIVGPLLGHRFAWRRDRRQLRAYGLCTAVWGGRDVVESLVRVPLYLSGNLAGLAIVQILGWPLFAATLYAWWVILHRAQVFVTRATPSEAAPRRP